MLTTIDLRGSQLSRAEYALSVPRPTVDIDRAVDAVAVLVHDVRDRGVDALHAQSERFDGVRSPSIRVPQTVIDSAVAELDHAVREAVQLAIERVRQASRAQVPDARVTRFSDGATVTQRWVPVRRAGLYAPGGKAVYPSSVVMNVVPAQVAGVEAIALASPPQREFGGHPHPTILAAAGLLGIDEVYAMGGAGAIGAFAYGVPGLGLEAVDVITGPGNVFVAAAKRLVRGVVGIDAEAGTTEILVIADERADARLVAYDLVSQAEHDEAAASVLVTDSEQLARRVREALPEIVTATRHTERVTTALAGPQSALVLVDDLRAAADFSNAYAPEHLEIQVADEDAVLARITNAGAVFLGPDSPVSVGDYLAGSNHVLPTGGTARFTSGLAATSFLKPQQVIRYDRPALVEVGAQVVALANAEELPAHGEAVSARLD